MSNYISVAHDKNDLQITLMDIPFSLGLKYEYPKSYEDNETIDINSQEAVQMAFFTGMVTKSARCSEWWGQCESAYNYSNRIFIGDCLSYIEIIYHDNLMEIIPLIFGFNVWNYELYFQRKENEEHLESFGGPYNEPFASDENAKKLLDNALCLNELDECKALKYIMAVRLKNRPVKSVRFRKTDTKNAGVYVSAVTFLKCSAPCPFDTMKNCSFKIIEPSALLKCDYQYTLGQLARRLYQFKEDIPQHVPAVNIDGFTGPKISFLGGNAAEILTNVYTVNIHDMATQKVSTDGMTHTSSHGAPSFGMYVGMGTFMNHVGQYYNQIWSRDVGRLLNELCFFGVKDRILPACNCLMKFLYDKSLRYPHPNWKRVINASQFNDSLQNYVAGKENDGHASLMLAIYTAFRTGVLNTQWMDTYKNAIEDAADWFFWQIDNPEQSHFDKVLHSESEASTQSMGGYDLFSNTISYYALIAFERMSIELGWHTFSLKCAQTAQQLMNGILQTFIFNHPKYGQILVDNTYDCWTYDYKRLALLFLLPDVFGYDIHTVNPIWETLCRNTFTALTNGYFNPDSGRQMGYGQGYITQICALLDDVEDFTNCVESAAYFCYHEHDHNYIVPEGVIRHGSGRFWFRNCDLGNTVQQAEIIKICRLILGIDNLSEKYKLSLIPRLPANFTGFSVEDYPALTENGTALISLNYQRTPNGYHLTLDATQPVLLNTVRFGPFANPIQTTVPTQKIDNYNYALVSVQEMVTHWEYTIES